MGNLDTKKDKSAGMARKQIHLSKKLILESIKLAPSHSYSIQLVRSFAVSVIAMIVNFSASFLFNDVLHVYYLLAASAGFLLGVLVNYYLSVKWVFATRKLESKKAEFFIFVVITTLGLIFNLAIIAGMVELLKVAYWPSLVTATIVVFFWNFIARKKILY